MFLLCDVEDTNVPPSNTSELHLCTNRSILSKSTYLVCLDSRSCPNRRQQKCTVLTSRLRFPELAGRILQQKLYEYSIIWGTGVAHRIVCEKICWYLTHPTMKGSSYPRSIKKHQGKRDGGEWTSWPIFARQSFARLRATLDPPDKLRTFCPASTSPLGKCKT